ncbi:ATP-binding protein [Kitasatospora sp. NPDC018619]|uniref:ATP-binding protein n=1 Tax=unclassified Kitasatospora TaxID=2633591 RepID=UPI0037A97550
MSQARPGFSQLALADTPNAVAWARRHTVDVLRCWQVPPETVQTARLIVSELVTNAIRDSRPGEEISPYSPLSQVRTVTLTLWLERGRLTILVHDHDDRPPVVKSVGEDAESGRGVFLVEALSELWGYYYDPGSAGKVVWSELLTAARDPRFGDDSAGGKGSARDKDATGRSYEDTPLVVARALMALREL